MSMIIKTYGINANELYHTGIKGMKWGIRRYQNADGTLTDAGKKRYYKNYGTMELSKKGQKAMYDKNGNPTAAGKVHEKQYKENEKRIELRNTVEQRKNKFNDYMKNHPDFKKDEFGHFEKEIQIPGQKNKVRLDVGNNADDEEHAKNKITQIRDVEKNIKSFVNQTKDAAVEEYFKGALAKEWLSDVNVSEKQFRDNLELSSIDNNRCYYYSPEYTHYIVMYYEGKNGKYKTTRTLLEG